MSQNSARPATLAALPSTIADLLERDPELAIAVTEVDRTLIELAMMRTVKERLRAGVAMANLAARLRR